MDGWREVEFRGGKRIIPEHLAILMSTFETYKMTFDEAVAKANQKLLSDHLAEAQNRLVTDHLKIYGGRS